jgi:hypothetical protein
MTTTISKGKTNPFLLSEQVKRILKTNGFTSLFNYTDYEVFKNKCKGTFDKAQEIARLFMAEAQPDENDFNQYIF